jgi:hypothetical protein
MGPVPRLKVRDAVIRIGPTLHECYREGVVRAGDGDGGGGGVDAFFFDRFEWAGDPE